jgi:hypothetical protein
MKNNKIFSYSKLIFRDGIEVPPKSPPSVDSKLESQRKKTGEALKKKQEKLEAAKRYKSKREELYHHWIENNPKGKIEAIEDSPKYTAMNEIADPFLRKEAFLMLSLIEKHWGKDEAWKQYNKCWEGGSFYIKRLSDFFSKKNAGKKLGFYFATRTIKWRPDLSWQERNEAALQSLPDNVKTLRNHWYNATPTGVEVTEKVTGWWTVDFNTEKKDYIKGGKDFEKVRKNRLVGDEWAGKYLFKALPEIRKELSTPKGKPGYNDSGLTPAQEKARLEDLDEYEKTVRTLSKDQAKKDVYTWFKKQPHNKWIQPDKEIIGKLNYLYGKGCGKYLYRYSPDNKKIYVIKIEGEIIPEEWGTGGYIDIKEGKVDMWQDYKNSEEFFKSEVIDKMTPEQVEKELAMYRAAAGKETKSDKEKLTSGIIAKLKKIPSAVEYSKLKSGYIALIQKKLEKYFKNKKKYSEKKASELARYRAEKTEEAIRKQIEAEDMNEILEENPDTKLKIRIDSNDQPKVEIADRKQRKKWLEQAKQAAEEGIMTAENLAGRVKTELSKKMGPMWTKLLDWIFNFNKQATEGFSTTFKLVVGLFGGGGVLALSSSMVGAKKIEQAELDKIIKPGNKEQKIKRKRYVKNGLKLNKPGKERKVIIPRGLGIVPGGKMYARLDGKTKTLTEKGERKEKEHKEKSGKKNLFKGAGFFSLLLGGGKEEKGGFNYTDKEIEIDREIPAGTVLPKGAKIVRV